MTEYDKMTIEMEVIDAGSSIPHVVEGGNAPQTWLVVLVFV